MSQPKPAAAKKNPWAPVILIIVLLIALFVVKQCKKTGGETKPTTTTTTEPTEEKNIRGLNRHPTSIKYSNHARCRMGCRQIDETEVKEILETGKINYSKSDLKAADCQKRYAVEGTTHDQQRVRFIFAPCNTEVTVVTVIDIGKEWPCDCK